MARGSCPAALAKHERSPHALGMCPAADNDPLLTLLNDIHGDPASRREQTVQRALEDLEQAARPARTALENLRAGRRTPPVGLGPKDAIPVDSGELLDAEVELVSEAGVPATTSRDAPPINAGKPLGTGPETAKFREPETITVVTGRGRDVIFPPPLAANIDRSAKDR